MRPEKALRYYQRWMDRMIREHPGLLLSIPMGFGKTGAALTAVKKLLLAGEVTKVLIVAPLRVARDTWPDEILEWEHTCEIPFTLIRAEDHDPEIISAGQRAYDRIQGVVGGVSKIASRAKGYVITDAKTAKRARLAMEETPIHIINREAIPWLVRFFGKRWPYDMLIYDEASRLKEGRMRTEGGKEYAAKKGPKPLSEFGSLVRVRHKFKRVVELSGTPSPNGEIDLWGPIYMLDRGERLGRTKTAFKKRWFDENPYTYETKARPGAIDEITDRIKDVMFSLDEDELDLPPIVFNNINVRLDPEHLRQYRQFEEDLVSEAYDVEAVSKGVLSNKLLQFANGSMYRQTDRASKRETIHIHDKKLEALESIVEEEGRNPILVAYSFKFDLERIKKRFKHAVVMDEDPDFVKNWNAGKIRLALAHPASIGHGLNLQYGGHIAVWFGLTWSLELYLQFNKRLPRPGQKNKFVTIHHILAEGTNDFRQLTALRTKGITQDEINASTRAHLRGLEATLKRYPHNPELAHRVWDLVG